MVHCDSPPVTGVSRSPLCGTNTKHLRRKKISVHHLVLDRSNKNQYVVAEFYPWFKFSFLFLQNHTIPSAPHPHPPKKKERERRIKFQPKIKLNHNKYICQLPFSRSYMSFLEYYAEKKESPTGVTNYFKTALQEKLKSLRREREKFSPIALWCMLFF